MARGLQAPSGLESVLGRLDGSIDVLGSSSRYFSDHLANDGVVHTTLLSVRRSYDRTGIHVLEGGSVNRVYELAIDEQAGVHLGGTLIGGSVELVGESARHVG